MNRRWLIAKRKPLEKVMEQTKDSPCWTKIRLLMNQGFSHEADKLIREIEPTWMPDYIYLNGAYLHPMILYLESKFESVVKLAQDTLLRSRYPVVVKKYKDESGRKQYIYMDVLQAFLCDKTTAVNEKIIERFLARGGSPNFCPDVKGRTSLMWAVKRNNVNIALALMVKGADMTARDKKGRSFIFYAKSAKMMDVLLKYDGKNSAKRLELACNGGELSWWEYVIRKYTRITSSHININSILILSDMFYKMLRVGVWYKLNDAYLPLFFNILIGGRDGQNIWRNMQQRNLLPLCRNYRTDMNELKDGIERLAFSIFNREERPPTYIFSLQIPLRA